MGLFDWFRTKVKKCLDEHKKDLDYEDLRAQIDATKGLDGIVGQDPRLLRVLEIVRQIAFGGSHNHYNWTGLYLELRRGFVRLIVRVESARM